MNLADNIGVVYGKSNGWSVPIIGIIAFAIGLLLVGRASVTQPVSYYLKK